MEKEINGETYRYQSAVGNPLNPQPVWVKVSKHMKPEPEQKMNPMPMPPLEEIHKRHKLYA